MTAFIRRYESNPGLDVLSEIEGVVILDQEPAGQVAGTGSRPVLLIGEFEDGPFNTPTELFGETDQFRQFGSFGFTYDGVPSNHPCARSRKPDSQIAPEYWSGNAFLWLSGKRFRRLFVCRVDTSVGSVSFTRLASISGGDNPTFDLEPGQTLILNVGGGDLTCTFAAAAATIVSGNGTYPSTFTGGESITFAIDGTQYTAVFLAADQSQTQVIARMNAACGFTAFTNAGPGTDDTTLTGRKRGTGGSVQIVSVSGALVTTATGFSAGAAVAGTGDVADIDAVTVTEANTVVFADTSSAVRVDRDAFGRIRLVNVATPGTGTLLVQDTSTATAFGFATETTASAAVGVNGFIPAGTRVQTAGGNLFVTMQTLEVTAEAVSGLTPSGAGPYSVKVRHALDDTTGTSAGVGTVTTMTGPVESGAWAVTNNLSLSAALSEAAIDSAYIAALDTTTAIASAVREVNIVAAARSSNAIRSALRSNAIDASANGCRGRVAVVRPPFGTTRAVARSGSNSQPSVGAYRSDRLWYGFPAVRQRISRIATRGIAGGAGFTADGVINVGFDAAIASLSSVLPPEENIGQLTEHLVWIVGIESGNSDVANLTIEDYKAFKRAGIMAPNLIGTPELQSAVTSVDPTLQPARVNANRRAFTDYLLDSLAEFARPFQKKLNTKTRRAQFIGALKGFTGDLVRLERAERDLIDGVSGNTAEQLARGIYWVKVTVRMVSTLEVIVIDGVVGENVTFAEAA